MKNSTSLLAALALSATVCASHAQDQDGPRRRPGGPQGEGRPDGAPQGEFRGRPEGGPGDAQRPPRGEGGPQGERGPGGPGGEGQRRFVPPIVAALDANGDGVIDETEMKNATAALKKLDKNNDGQLSMEELMPPRMQGQRGQGGQGGGEGRGPGLGGPEGRPPGGPGNADAPRRPRGEGQGAPEGERPGRPQRPPAEQ